MQLRQVDIDGLTERRAKLLQCLLHGMTIPEASIAAGYSHETGGYQAVASPIFQKALHSARDRIIKTEGATLGLQVLMDLAKAEKTPASVRYQAASKLVALAGHVEPKADEGGGKKPMSEMSEDELREIVEQAEQRLAEGAQPALAHRSDGDSAQPGHNPPPGPHE